MSSLPNVSRGLWNLASEERRKVYADLRKTLGLSEKEPLLPLPPAELKLWARRFAEHLNEALKTHPVTLPLAGDVPFLERALLEYGLPASDELFDSHLPFGQNVAQAGVSSLYLGSLLNVMGMSCSARAALEVLSTEGQRIALERYPVVMLLRHALMQEVALGAR